MAVAAILTGAVPAWASSQSSARIAGTVVSEGGDAAASPVNRAFVALSGGALRRVVLSDGDGRFAFDAAPDGDYLLTAAKAGFVTSTYGALRPGGEGTPIVVRAGQPVADLQVRLVRGAVITGTIRAVDGQPAPNIRVTVRRSGSTAARPQPFETTVTDDRGVYRIFGLSQGPYLVEATPGVISSGGMRVMSTSGVDAELAGLARIYGGARGPSTMPSRGRASDPGMAAASYTYAPVFYPSTTRVADAVPIEVRAGEERTAIDFSLVLAGTTTISGSVVGTSGEPVTGVTVAAIRLESAAAPLGLRPTLSRVQGSDGTFRIANVTPGRYVVRAQTVIPGTSTTPSRVGQWATEEVEVVGAAIAGLSLRLQPALTVSGRLMFERTELQVPADFSTFRVTLRSRDGERPGLGVAGPPPATVRADGTFQIDGIAPDVYDVEIAAPRGPAPGWWPRSARLAGRDLLDEPLVVDGTSRGVGGIIVVLSDRPSSLSGALENLAGRPAPGYVVIAFAADPRLWSASRRVAATRPATDGRFVVRDLPPGDYLLAVVGDVAPDAWRQPEFLGALTGTSVRVTIGEGEQKVQNLRVER
jgi:hypothetical protein